jgi:mRNA-degrading endonuclease RelE of RelBE toxin-antitoxin system
VAGGKKTPGKRPPAGEARAARALPDPKGDAPLQELSRDALSVLLYVALLPEEARAIVKELGLSVPGFRTEALSDVETCDVLADEIRAAPAARAHVIDRLRAAFGGMPLPDVPLDPPGADDLLAVGSSEHGLTFALWRVLADPDPAVRARAKPSLDRLVKDYYGPAPGGAKPRAKPEDAAERVRGLEERLAQREKELEKERADAEARLASARKKGEEQREKLQAWLKEARAREARAVEEAARAREAADAAEQARGRAEARLAEAQATDAAAEAQRARAVLREVEGKLATAEARLARQEERARAVEAELEETRSRAAPERPPAAVPGEGAEPPDEAEEAPATWLMPVYTREFYDSLEGWDRRIQRAAFKQANLLAQDHRHPSLRALPLEGLPGYYRVRVATDVRLLYRRGDRQNTIEVLSLIDREDLDRYVRQAKTRSS